MATRIEIVSREQARFYLAALIDGEGSISRGDKCISVTNTDDGVVSAFVTCCTVLGYHHKVYGPYQRGEWKPVWEMRISGCSTMEKAAQELPLQESNKAELLDFDWKDRRTSNGRPSSLSVEAVAHIKSREFDRNTLARIYNVSYHTIRNVQLGVGGYA